MEVYPMDPTVKHVLDQSFANTHQMFSSAAAQFTRLSTTSFTEVSSWGRPPPETCRRDT
jgi:hypothetical protein